jgi:hypothetical protein
MTSQPSEREHITDGLNCWCNPYVESYGDTRITSHGENSDEEASDDEDSSEDGDYGAEVANQVIAEIDEDEGKE